MFDEDYEDDLGQWDNELDLFGAVSGGSSSEVQMVINAGNVDIDEADKNGDTVLHLAVKAGDLDMARVLVREGDADTTIKNKEHDTPLHIAAASGNLEIVQTLLVRSEKSIKDHKRNLVLCHAAIAKKDGDGNTALHIAAASGYVDIVHYLLRKGAELSVRNHEGATALELAICSGRLDIVQQLIKRSDDKAERDIHGHSPLHQAAIYGKNDLIQWLILSANADLFEESGYEQTALFLALENKHFSTAQLLLDLGAGLKADLTDMDLSSLDMKNCLLIGAEVKGEPIRMDMAINEVKDLHKALLHGEPLNGKALRKAVASRMQAFPEDEQLKQIWHGLSPICPNLKKHGLSGVAKHKARSSDASVDAIITCKGP